MLQIQNINTGGIKSFLNNRKMFVNLVIMILLISALPVVIYLVRQQQILKSRAAVDPITFSGANVVNKNNQFIALKSQITVDIISPLGPPTVENGYGQNVEGSQDREEGFPAQYRNYLPMGLVKEVYAGAKSNIYVDPATANSGGSVKVIATATSDCANNIVNMSDPKYSGNGLSCGLATVLTCGGNNPKDSNPCWWQWPCTAGAAGTFKATFNASGTGCLSETSYTVTGGGGGGGGKTKIYVDPNPANSGASVKVIATGPSDCANNIVNMSDPQVSGKGLSCGLATVLTCGGNNPKDSNPCWWQWPCTAGAAGTYTATFNASGTNCLSNTSYTVSGGGGTGGGKDSSGPGTACNVNIAYKDKPDLYALWDTKCDGKKQAAGSGIGQTCCELACGAAPSCDEQYADQGNCDANCQTPGTGGGGKDTSGPATACNVNIAYKDKPDLYALWDTKCDGKKQAAGSGIGQGCCELACGAASTCDEQSAGKGNCDANCQVVGAASPGTQPGGSPNPVSSPVNKPVTTSKPITNPSTKPSAFTTHYRIAENPTDLNNAAWETYKQPLSRSWELKDQTPGVKTIYVEFQDTAGKKGGCGANQSSPCSKQIRLAGSGPAIIGCSLSSEGNNTVVSVEGTNFTNTRGSLESGGSSLQIRTWQDRAVTATGNMPADQTASITLTNGDGQTTEGQCSASSLLTLGARLLCSTSATVDLDNADLQIAGIFEGGKLTKQKVKVKKDGTLVGLNEKLQAGKKYKLSLKVPRSLRKTSDTFTAATGATNIPNFILPVGDIFPTDDDGVINAMDKGELNRQWIISGSAANRSGDLNGDGRVNSIDWACMRYGFGRSDESEPVPGAEEKPSQSPSVNPSPISSENPSPVATSSPAATTSPGSGTSPSVSPSTQPSFSPHPSSSPRYSFPSPSSGGWRVW